MEPPSQLLEDANFSVLTCIQCGTCTGSCPSGRFTAFNTRRIVLAARRNEDVYHDPNLWMCTTCYQCQERCPREIDIVDAILALRSEAVHAGIMLQAHRDVCELMIETGHAVPIDEETKMKRERLGMRAIPETVHSFPDALKDVKTLLASTGFDRLLKNDS